jgi:hypothetical protein
VIGWARTVVAPWWVRWLVNSAIAAVVLVALSAVLFPTLYYSFGWLGGLLVLLVFGLAVGALMARLQTSIANSYAPALTGLDLQQRTQVYKAVRGGPVPDDPRALAAAARVGVISLAFQRRAPRWQKTTRWWAPVLYVVIGVIEFLLRDPRQGLVWTAVALFFAILLPVQTRRSRRLPHTVERLRAAASEIPEVVDVEDTVVLPPRRMRTTVLLLLVLGLAFGTVLYLWGFPRHAPDCRTADKVVDLIYTHPKLLDANLITPGDPALSRYQDWSNQLQDYARQVTAADLAPHLHRIAELSAQAVALVADLRKDPAGSLPPDIVSDRQAAYQKIINELISEDDALNAICHAHS